MDRLIGLLKSNARMSNSELAVMLGKSEQEVKQEIERLENEGIIQGYTAIIDESAYDPNSVFALIELKVTPQSQSGFDEIARQISGYEQVEAVRLMSGTYDIIVEVTGKNIRDISLFVSQRLATIAAVQETTTHFGLRVYKDNGIIIGSDEKDEAEFRRELERRGIRDSSEAVLKPFYPDIKRKITDSWKKIFRHDAEIKKALMNGTYSETEGMRALQAGLWCIKKEWLI